LVVKNDYDKAIRDYEQAIRLDPQFASGHYSCAYAFAYYKRGFAWSTKRNTTRRSRTRTGHPARSEDAYYYFQPRLRLGLQEELRQGDPGLRRGHRPRSAKHRLLLVAGHYLDGQEDYAKAIKDFDKAIQLDPKFEAATTTGALLGRTKREVKFPALGTRIGRHARFRPLDNRGSGGRWPLRAARQVEGQNRRALCRKTLPTGSRHSRAGFARPSTAQAVFTTLQSGSRLRESPAFFAKNSNSFRPLAT